MKMRKKIAALLAAAMIAAVMPMSAFADSKNRVDTVLTVPEDYRIKSNEASNLKIKMEDDLDPGKSFYLEIEGGEWTANQRDTKIVVRMSPITGYSLDDEDTEELTTIDAITLKSEKPGVFELSIDHVVAEEDANDFIDWLVRAIQNTLTQTDEGIVLENDMNVREELDKIVAKAVKEAIKSKDNTGTGELNYAIKSFKAKVEGLSSTYALPGTEVTVTQENSKVLAVKTTTGKVKAGDTIEIPLLAKVTGSEAVVKVKKYDTEVSESSHVFAVTGTNRARVDVRDVPNFHRTTEIADIAIEEIYAEAFKGTKDEERWFTLELRDPDFIFNVPSGTITNGELKGAGLVGERAFRGKIQLLTEDVNYKMSADRTRLLVKIDNTIFGSAGRERGNAVLKGIEVIAARDARDGEVKATIESKKLFDKEIITIAKKGDYKTKLDVPKDWKYEVVAGTEKEVTFTLTEELANSLIGTRPATFTFDKGVTIVGADTSAVWGDWKADGIVWDEYKDNTKIRKVLAELEELENEDPKDTAKIIDKKIELFNLLKLYEVDGHKRPTADIKSGINLLKITGSKNVGSVDQGEWPNSLLGKRVHVADNNKSFTVDNFHLDQNKAGSYEFKTTLKIPANVEGDIKVAVAGAGVTEEEIVILKAEAPVTVDTTGVDIKVGLKEIETTGKIVIKETKEGMIRQGKDIVLRIADIDNGLKIKSFDIEVVEGDLQLADKYGEWKAGDQAKGVRRVSTKASTIEITNIKMFTDRTVPEGKYDLLVGGNAISDHAKNVAQDKGTVLDPVKTVKEFVNITTKNTEDIADPVKATVAFTVGSADFLINGETATMDAAAYVKDGRTMVPVRYVAQALGVNEEQVTWDGPSQTATIIADKVIQVKLGSKAMLVNGANVPMEAAAELTNDRTFVPMGDIARALGVVVEWDNDTKTATFNPAK